MSNHTIGFGIVGTGSIAQTHAEALKQVPGAELRAVFNRSPDKAAVFAATHQATPEIDLDSLLARDDIAVICVTTPTGSHGNIAIAALEAGKHVLCEKPLEINVERVDAMIAAAKKNGKILAAVFQSRFGQGAQTLKHAISQGRFGQLTLCSAYVKWWRTQQYYNDVAWRGTWQLDGGGALMNQGIHAVDLLQWLVGMPSEVSTFTAKLAHERMETEDTLVANLRFPHGALGSIECATSSYPGFARRVEISGDQGTAVVEDDRIKTWDFVQAQPEDEAIRNGDFTTALKSGASDPRAISNLGHRLQMTDLVDAIQSARPPIISGEEGRNAVQLVTAIYQSAAESRVVSI
jgi:UDP-N-acetyl-2-amino-2-deoxyglucuronate dehydrogenase